MTDLFKKLAAEFPKSAIHWRAQKLTKTGDKAMALAYLDARDVRQRLNEVCGPENWSCEHFDCGGGRLGCRLSIRVGDEWISKTDGAGDTQIEAEKGAFSGALKRAAVAWGVGEYLYDMPTIWVPCETWTDDKGKPHWSRWKADPWQFVRGNGAPQSEPPSNETPPAYTRLSNEIQGCESKTDLKNWWEDQEVQGLIKSLPEVWQQQITSEKDAMKSALEAAALAATP